jgi:hypothetical protein
VGEGLRRVGEDVERMLFLLSHGDKESAYKIWDSFSPAGARIAMAGIAYQLIAYRVTQGHPSADDYGTAPPSP